MIKHLDLFSGIGGFALAAQMTGGIEVQQFVEIDSYCQKVLAKNFPGVPIHDDIRTFTAKLGDYDLITGGFPCQDISCANPNGRGLEGERSGLFYELMRIVRTVRPRYLVLENVSAMLTKHDGRIMGAVLRELSQSGFNAEWQVISAASVGAPHLRERVFIVAYSDSQRRDNGRDSRSERSTYRDDNGQTTEALTGWSQLQSELRATGKANALCDANCQRLENTSNSNERRQIPELGSVAVLPHAHRPRREKLNTATIPTEPRHDTRGITPSWNPWRTEPGVLRVANGIPHRVDRIRGLGNAVVPQVAIIPLLRILEIAQQRQRNFGNLLK